MPLLTRTLIPIAALPVAGASAHALGRESDIMPQRNIASDWKKRGLIEDLATGIPFVGAILFHSSTNYIWHRVHVTANTVPALYMSNMRSASPSTHEGRFPNHVLLLRLRHDLDDRISSGWTFLLN